MLKKVVVLLAMGAFGAHTLFDDAAAQIRRYDPATGGTSNLSTPSGGTLTPQPRGDGGVRVQAPQPQTTPEVAPEEVVKAVVEKNPLGAAMVFIDSKTETDPTRMADLLKIRDLIGQGMLVDFYAKDETIDPRKIDKDAFQKNMIELVKLLPQAQVGEFIEPNDMIGFPAVTYDHRGEMAKEHGVTVFPSVVYQVTPEAEKKVFPIGEGIGKFMSAVNDRKRELQEKKR